MNSRKYAPSKHQRRYAAEKAFRSAIQITAEHQLLCKGCNNHRRQTNRNALSSRFRLLDEGDNGLRILFRVPPPIDKEIGRKYERRRQQQKHKSIPGGMEHRHFTKPEDVAQVDTAKYKRADNQQ